MTYIVYLDEQEGEIDGEAFTAVIGFRVRANDMIRIRAEFYPLYNDILDRNFSDQARTSGRRVHSMPDLHGSDLLRDYSDDIKFEVLDALARCLASVDCDFLRIGYFNRSFPDEMMMGGRDAKINFATASVGFAILDKVEEYHVLVSEFDKEALRRSLNTTYSNLSTLFAAGEKNVSFNLMRFVGHYRAPKSELGCQIADVVNYCCLKFSRRTNNFNIRLSSYYESLADRYIVNQIVWVNDEGRTRYFDQKNPVSHGSERRDTDPLTRVFRIIPDDQSLETEEIPPVA